MRKARPGQLMAYGMFYVPHIFRIPSYFNINTIETKFVINDLVEYLAKELKALSFCKLFSVLIQKFASRTTFYSYFFKIVEAGEGAVFFLINAIVRSCQVITAFMC